MRSNDEFGHDVLLGAFVGKAIRPSPFDNSAATNYIVHKSLTISEVRMDRFENARVFVAVVEAGGFTRAAERLGLSRAAASKHVLQLEDRLGARLLNRTTRRVSVTAAGRAFYEQCRRILAEFDEAERSAGELHNTPSGELRVVAPTNFGLAEIGTADCRFHLRIPAATDQLHDERSAHRPD